MPPSRGVLPAQHQNSNLTEELGLLLEDIRPGLPWAERVFGGPPEVRWPVAGGKSVRVLASSWQVACCDRRECVGATAGPLALRAAGEVPHRPWRGPPRAAETLSWSQRPQPHHVALPTATPLRTQSLVTSPLPLMWLQPPDPVFPCAVRPAPPRQPICGSVTAGAPRPSTRVGACVGRGVWVAGRFGGRS